MFAYGITDKTSVDENHVSVYANPKLKLELELDVELKQV
jgi:hypothetical protein